MLDILIDNTYIYRCSKYNVANESSCYADVLLTMHVNADIKTLSSITMQSFDHLHFRGSKVRKKFRLARCNSVRCHGVTWMRIRLDLDWTFSKFFTS